MPSPTECPRTPRLAPDRGAQLDGGLRYEQAGLAARAIVAYEAALAASADAAEEAEARLRLARVHRTVSDWDQAVREARLAVRLADRIGAHDLAAEAINVEVGVHQLRGEFEAGDALAVRGLARARAPRVRGLLLQNRGAIAAQRRDFVGAQAFFTSSVSAFRDAGYELGLAIALNNASAAARDAGDPAGSLELGRQAADAARRLDALDVLLLAVQNQAHALVALGRLDEAEALLGEALGHFASTHNLLRQAECLEIIGELHVLRPEFRDTAARSFELAATLADRVGDRVLSERIRSRLARATDASGAA